jgi:hypothetical protein
MVSCSREMYHCYYYELPLASMIARMVCVCLVGR